MNLNRYQIKTGKYGMYFYDTDTGQDMTLVGALEIMNRSEMLQEQIIRRMEAKLSEQEQKVKP